MEQTGTPYKVNGADLHAPSSRPDCCTYLAGIGILRAAAHAGVIQGDPEKHRVVKERDGGRRIFGHEETICIHPGSEFLAEKAE